MSYIKKIFEDKKEKERLLKKYGSFEQGLELVNKRYDDIISRFNAKEAEQDSCLKDILTKIDTSSVKDLTVKLNYGISLLKERKDILNYLKTSRNAILEDNKDDNKEINLTTIKKADDMVFCIDNLINVKINFYNEQCIPVYQYYSAKYDEMMEKRDGLYDIDREYKTFYMVTVHELKQLCHYEKNRSILNENSGKLGMENDLMPGLRFFSELNPFREFEKSMNEFEALVKETRFADSIQENDSSKTSASLPASDAKQDTENTIPTTNKDTIQTDKIKADAQPKLEDKSSLSA